MSGSHSIQHVGIVGLGSIGRRHVRILKSLRPDLIMAAYRTNKGGLRGSLDDVFNLERDVFLAQHFDLVVIANPSALHLDSLAMVLSANPKATVLVEKPFCLPEEMEAARLLMAGYPQARVLPGCCLRFHPAVAVLREEIQRAGLGKAVECHAHFGSYMPGWHPYEDYRTTYAARRSMGGGVLLTSIHEIDLAHHLFGDCQVIGSMAGNFVLHEIDVEDTAHMILSLQHCKICNISLNLFERPSRRYLKIVFQNGTFYWNFSEPQVTITSWQGRETREQIIPVDANVDSMYMNMWQNVLNGRLQEFELASVTASLKTVAAILARTESIAWK
jgi:predicted dehydrogenase